MKWTFHRHVVWNRWCIKSTPVHMSRFLCEIQEGSAYAIQDTCRPICYGEGGDISHISPRSPSASTLLDLDAFCQILSHDSVSVIVSRFTSCTENFVIRCYQVTTIICSRYGCASAFSARSLVILDFMQMSQFRSFGK